MEIPVVIDDRERQGGLIEALARALPKPPQVRRLDLGDVQIGERIVVERKAAADFVASLLAGRLGSQLDRLLRGAESPVLLIEGEFTPHVLGGMALAEVRRAIVRVQLRDRIPVLRTRNAEESAQWIAGLALHAREQEADAPESRLMFGPPVIRSGAAPAAHRAAHRGTATRATGADPQLRFLLQIKGLGEEKARALLDRFSSLDGVKRASNRDILSLPGFGPTILMALRARLNR